MRINFIAPLLACAMAVGSCPAGALEAPLPVPDANVPGVDSTEPLELSSDMRFGNEAIVPVPVEETGNAGDIGASVDVMKLDRLRGGADTVENNVLLDGTVENNTAEHVVSGSNAISDGAFSNATGINTVIQNTGSNVLIQNAMMVNVQFVAPVVP